MKPLGSRRVFLAIAFLLVTVIFGCAGLKYYQVAKRLKNMEKKVYLPPKETKIEPLKPMNILLLGIDSGELMGSYRPGRGRSDTIMLFALRPDKKVIYQVSIPRDSRVEVPGHGLTKINHAYAYGGADLMQETVEKLLAIKIDRVVVIDYNGFVKLVDLLGGIEIDVEKDINNRFNIGKPIPTGHVRLTGEEAFRYVHARDSDIERVKRQQKFLKAVFQEVIEQKAYYKLFKFISENPEAVTTNFTISELAELVKHEDEFKNYKLEEIFAEGRGQYIDGISYWILNEKAIQNIREKLK
ncbi:MAG: polyisoprenyl-teichoic acid--peptidoglycan teichoic acid transferase [Eubacteriales bacterium]|nr:polyisoprenyl-teichoic acid--peptidoglycan teichoic acid transferase [Eubacteriales bacterium]